MASGRMFESLKDFGQILSTRIKNGMECVETFASETNMKRLKYNEINSEISHFLAEQKEYLVQFKISYCDIANADTQATK